MKKLLVVFAMTVVAMVSGCGAHHMGMNNDATLRPCFYDPILDDGPSYLVKRCVLVAGSNQSQ